MSIGVGKTVCVTGASGYIASWLVKLLLQRGYTIKASVRDPNDPRKTQHLLELWVLMGGVSPASKVSARLVVEFCKLLPGNRELLLRTGRKER